ncbi:MAG TPA: AAA family ATPase [Pyrinomonadaceae bacterium]|nr:AAA family ATPase [Pyrinomonadaceae bacterium]
MDAEDQARILSAFQEKCEQAVRQFGGTVVQRNEKGLLACFGFPVAYENAGRRAARSGLAILESVKNLNEQFRLNQEIIPWAGIHTGPVLAETKDGAVSLVGEARNVALRLEDVAAPGQVICTEVTNRIFKGRFQCASLGSHQIKGVSHPLELFRVERVVTGSLLETVAPAELSPLTGRDHEISLLKERWEQAQEGMGQVVLLIGEPGLGKSRLVHTMKQHVLAQMVEGEVDSPVIEWRCSPRFQNTRLYPAIDFYERALGIDREDSPQHRFEQLLNRLEAYDLAQPEVVPLWASLLSLPASDAFPPLCLSPVRQREETFRVMLDWLRTRAARKPILFIVEDLHWIDASTLDFLGQFLAEGLHDSILTILTFRPEFQTPWPAVAQQTSLALNRLTRRQAAELMRKKSSMPLPEDLIEQVYERTAGVPLFLEEVTRTILESGALERAPETDTPNWLKREIPATLQDLVMARLERLEGDRDLAQLAATLGREFNYDLVAAVSSLQESALETELIKLVNAEILYQKGRPPRRTYIFKHALLEDALYNAMVKGKRQSFHRQIAEVLEAQFQQTAETRPELLAHHFTEGALTEKAVGYWLKAGIRSREKSANVEAISHLTKGLELLGTLEESPQRDAQELQFLNPLGSAFQASRGYAAAEVAPVFQRSRELCDRVGNNEERFAMIWGNWAHHEVRAQFRRCMDEAAEAMELAEKLADPGMLMEALWMLGDTLFHRADFASARDCFTRALNEYEDRTRTKFWSAYTGQDCGVAQRCSLSLAMWYLGYPDQALQINREMRELARSLGQPRSIAYALHHTAWLYQHCRLGAEALETAEEQIDLAVEQGFAGWRATGTVYRGAALMLQGQLNEALPVFQQGLDAYRAIGAAVAVPYYLSVLAEAFTHAERFDEALNALDEALAIVDKNDDRFQEAELHRLKGELYLDGLGDEAAAEKCFLSASRIAQDQQSKAWELRTSLSLARLWQRQGRREKARVVLAAVFDTYTEGFKTPDLVDAESLLNTLS